MIDTPYLEVDVDRLTHNLTSLADRARSTGVDVRPHAKTHKCAEIARMQLDLGAVGLTVATIGEAEAFADAAEITACTDVFIAYPIWATSTKAARLRALADRVSLRVGIDSVEGARHLGSLLGEQRIEVVVEVDSGQHRTGAAPEQAGDVAAAGAAAGLDIVGVFTFPGHGYGVGDTRRRAAEQEVAALRTAAQSLRAQGIDPRVRSGGSTPTVDFVGDPSHAGVLTEIRPGVYPLNDAQQVEIGTCGFDDVALTAVATVVRSEPGRIVVDAGSKILGADRAAWATGHGRLLDHPEARVVQLSEHHAVVEFPTESTPVPRLGDVIRVVPNHVCNAVNLVDELVAIDGSDSRWPVIARGRNS
ncbi:D-TA family PLP-dependent enzyme [Gordonia sp. JH63]|uniref:alanine racemase n=1 Tax=Gordonia sp. JH63 TaxID=2698900 RepID=UPI00131F938D|nr:alanine racemase [Gordonia sp. JH63]QHD85348.1 D-TA family PLP-dependent enzyme [Gordonia sp. JH63]